MFNSKKGFEQWWLIMMIFSFFTLFLLFSFFSNLGGTADSSDARACSLLFSNGLSSNAFYSDDLKSFNERFFDFTEEKCQSFTLKDIETRDVPLVANEIDKCWELMGSGDVILPREMFGEGICFYCGDLTLDSSLEFGVLQSQLNKEHAVIQNDFQKIEVNAKELGVFYYQYRESLSGSDVVGSYIDSKISDFGGLFKGSTDLFQPDVNIYTGITFAELKGDDNNEFYLDGVPLNEKLNCKTIVPSED
jgi:hypothetical protein